LHVGARCGLGNRHEINETRRALLKTVIWTVGGLALEVANIAANHSDNTEFERDSSVVFKPESGGRRALSGRKAAEIGARGRYAEAYAILADSSITVVVDLIRTNLAAAWR
jgi:hypothetical protein